MLYKPLFHAFENQARLIEQLGKLSEPRLVRVVAREAHRQHCLNHVAQQTVVALIVVGQATSEEMPHDDNIRPISQVATVCEHAFIAPQLAIAHQTTTKHQRAKQPMFFLHLHDMAHDDVETTM